MLERKNWVCSEPGLKGYVVSRLLLEVEEFTFESNNTDKNARSIVKDISHFC